MNSKSEILNLYKVLGETPLECLYRFKETHPEYKDMKMTYAGRLDPMAEGVLVVLAESIDAVKKQEIIENDKDYEFEILWGFETDTYDVLGLVTNVGKEPLKHFDTKIGKILTETAKKKTQEYPPYSSRTVSGKTLFNWAREGKIHEIDIPSRGIKIFNISHIHTRLLKQDAMLAEIEMKVAKVHGDFRQQEIISRWRESVDEREQVLVSLCKATVSSGTYIRSLVHTMGESMGCGATAYSIKRTRVGTWKIDEKITSYLDTPSQHD